MDEDDLEDLRRGRKGSIKAWLVTHNDDDDDDDDDGGGYDDEFK
jgi:hypothetical protein